MHVFQIPDSNVPSLPGMRNRSETVLVVLVVASRASPRPVPAQLAGADRHAARQLLLPGCCPAAARANARKHRSAEPVAA